MSKPNLILPSGAPLIGPGGNNIQTARAKLTPEQYISRIIRRVEAARRQGTDQLCNMIVTLATEGWFITQDKNLPTMKAAITMATHLSRDINGVLHTKEERILRLGDDFVPALKLLHEEREKHAERDPETQAALDKKIDEIRGELTAPHSAEDDIPEVDPLATGG